jgi:glutamine synthetase adenylyltransferase
VGWDANIKLGPGGIREIEFIGQSFQLIRGGHDADLQIRPIREVLALLAQKQLMPESAVRGLDFRLLFSAPGRESSPGLSRQADPSAPCR